MMSNEEKLGDIILIVIIIIIIIKSNNITFIGTNYSSIVPAVWKKFVEIKSQKYILFFCNLVLGISSQDTTTNKIK